MKFGSVLKKDASKGYKYKGNKCAPTIKAIKN